MTKKRDPIDREEFYKAGLELERQDIVPGLVGRDRPKIEDTVLGAWVYCAQHLRPHRSGWCSVGVEDKVGLGSFPGTEQEQGAAAASKCRRLGLKLYDGNR